MPSIPGVILIEGRIKTLKEFFRVNLLLMNVSPIFTLHRPDGAARTPRRCSQRVAPAGGDIVAARHRARTATRTGEFIIRGDEKGIHTVIAHFGGKITGPFLQRARAVLRQRLDRPRGEGPAEDRRQGARTRTTSPPASPTTSSVEITNTDTELDALYTTMAIDVGGGADLHRRDHGRADAGRDDALARRHPARARRSSSATA